MSEDEKQETDSEETSVVRYVRSLGDAQRGRFGEYLLVEGNDLAMRYWKEARVGLRYGPVANEFEFCGFVLEGRARWTIGDTIFVVEKGSSWTIPSHTEHSMEVLETFTAVECMTRPRPGD